MEKAPVKFALHCHAASNSYVILAQSYTYVRFPSETVTRSGYQIRRKNFAVAAAKGGRVYSLVASARSDQYNAQKEQILQHIQGSFRLRR